MLLPLAHTLLEKKEFQVFSMIDMCVWVSKNTLSESKHRAMLTKQKRANCQFPDLPRTRQLHVRKQELTTKAMMDEHRK